MFSKLLGDPNTRKLKKYYPIVSDVNILEEDFALLTDDDLRSRIVNFADQLLYLEEHEPSYKVRIVGHSSGSFVLAMLAAELHRRSNHNICERLSLLTSGKTLLT